MMETNMNITLSADKSLIAKARKYAQKHNTTLNNLVREYLKKIVNNSDVDKAADEFEKLSNMNQLRKEDINRIIDAYQDFTVIDKYSFVAELFKIKEEDYNLSVMRYVDILDPPELVNIQETIYETEKLEEEGLGDLSVILSSSAYHAGKHNLLAAIRGAKRNLKTDSIEECVAYAFRTQNILLISRIIQKIIFHNFLQHGIFLIVMSLIMLDNLQYKLTN